MSPVATRWLRPLLVVAMIAVAVEARAQTPEPRGSIVARAHVWAPTNIAAMDLKRGPRTFGPPQPGDTVRCEFVDRSFDGKSPKFACVLPTGEEVKVKFGED